ncbi:bifunctional phosphopantothenoylcysteine decarboxylase/phosphopantothenate--cysteine ligase CoaBC [Euzebya sp.]|uniref:bifunctional phosphopantothenoylcysteine decarboxylase/phosphopantothenate--cysteine ligase CoaBC n=1 Tax=Euzebya sp. TaxID=1971409 RepID=UPI0035181790
MAPSLAGREVLLGVSGGVAAYKAASLARGLKKLGADVQVILTGGATRFVQPAQFEALTGRRCYTDTFSDVERIVHVEVARRADVAIFAPATTNLIAKFAAGIADDLVTSTFTCLTVPTVIAPAMHTEMWLHPATQAAVRLLAERGATIVGPGEGELAGGDVGPGRLEDEDVLLEAVLRAAGRADHPLSGRRVVVTAGGTRERLDPVRFLSNRSTGKMGYAIAEAAAAVGATVDLVAAPTALADPPGVTTTHVESALDMHAAVMALAPAADVIVKAAAVSDFRPVAVSDQKLKKDAWTGSGAEGDGVTLELARNPDILADLGRRDDIDAVLVGFAAETTDVESYGRGKLESKGADLIVVNDVSQSDAGFGVDTNRVVILGRDGFRRAVDLASKRAVADVILDLAAERLRG